MLLGGNGDCPRRPRVNTDAKGTFFCFMGHTLLCPDASRIDATTTANPNPRPLPMCALALISAKNASCSRSRTAQNADVMIVITWGNQCAAFQGEFRRQMLEPPPSPTPFLLSLLKKIAPFYIIIFMREKHHAYNYCSFSPVQ